MKALKEEAPKKALEELFDKPQPSQGTSVATKLEDLKHQIEDLQKQRDMLLSKERVAAIKDILEKMETFDITAKDLNLGSGNKPKEGRAKVAVKYKSGTNAWTGRGKQPKWVVEHLSSGGKLEELLVK
jgi:DNA-binding protein H-NS